VMVGNDLDSKDVESSEIYIAPSSILIAPKL
jgi:hypothetical protein